MAVERRTNLTFILFVHLCRFEPTTRTHTFPQVRSHFRRPRRLAAIRGVIRALATTDSPVVPVETVLMLAPEGAV